VHYEDFKVKLGITAEQGKIVSVSPESKKSTNYRAYHKLRSKKSHTEWGFEFDRMSGILCVKVRE